MSARLSIPAGSALVVVMAAGICWGGCGRAEPARLAPQTLVTAPLPPQSQEQSCAECHADIVSHYARSGMSHSWRPVEAGDGSLFSLPATVTDHVSGYRYEIAERPSGLWQVETYADDPAHQLERRAAFRVGSGKHAVAWVAEERGFLTELPVGWFADRQWRLNPGYEIKNQRFSRPITHGCVACHATDAVADSPTVNRFAGIKAGIDCSRCHGDPEQHVAYWKTAHDDSPPEAARLLDPKRLSAERANDLCLQCHLQGDVTVQLGASSPLNYHPGKRLCDQRHDFLIAGQPEMLGVASHGARMLRSRCFTGSGEKLTCIACHDPHRPASDLSAADYDRKCLECHQQDACSREGTRPVSGGCAACHMFKRPTREGLHLVFTEHAILRRPPEVASSSLASVSLLPPNAKVELISAWPSEIPQSAALGAAYVLLHETMGPQEPALKKGVELLQQAVIANPADVDSRHWLGSARLALGDAERARKEFQRVLEAAPTRHESRYRLGLAEEAAHKEGAAMVHYQRLLADVPSWTEPAMRLAQLRLQARQPREAAVVLRQVAEICPTAKAYASQALAERLAGASHEEAMTLISKAIALDSREAAAYVSRGTLLLLAGSADGARDDFRRALRLDPGDAGARQALEALSSEKR